MNYDMNSNYTMPQNNYIQKAYNHSMSPNMDGQYEQRNMYDFCKKHEHYFVMMETQEGQMYEGIIDKVEADKVYLLIPIGEQVRGHDTEDTRGQDRQYGYGGYGGFGHGGYGFPFIFRRFRRFPFPFFGIRRFFFPFFF